MSDLALMEEVCEPIPLPDVRDLDRMPSLPAWVALRVGSMREETQRSAVDGKYRSLPTSPPNLTLSPAERAEIERYVRELEAFCAAAPLNSDECEGETLIIVTKLMLVLPAAQQNEAAVEATGEAFQAALDDVPTWAVAAAVRCWHRGDCGENERGQPYDYHWRPAPAELRKIALREKRRVLHRIWILRKLLTAEPLIEFGEDHCAAMCIRLATLSADLLNNVVFRTNAPVG